MQTDIELLSIAAATIACLHTLAGPDHYLPFIALSRARGWSFSRTIGWTIICGCGHVWSSVLLGSLGAAIGWTLSKVSFLESVRGGIAGWALLGFGLVYGAWGFLKAQQNIRHKHFDMADDGTMVVYEHKHGEVVGPRDRYPLTPWVLFIIFVLGPCEPMIPLLYFPAAKNSWGGMMLLIIIYTFFTLLTMVGMVIAGYYGNSMLKTGKMERYVHALGGMAIFICGVGMVFMGW